MPKYIPGQFVRIPKTDYEKMVMTILTIIDAVILLHEGKHDEFNAQELQEKAREVSAGYLRAEVEF